MPPFNLIVSVSFKILEWHPKWQDDWQEQFILWCQVDITEAAPEDSGVCVCVCNSPQIFRNTKSIPSKTPCIGYACIYFYRHIYILYIYMHVFAFMNISCICFFCTPTWVHTYRPPKPRFQTATVVLAHALACSSLEGQQDTTKKKRKTQKRRKQDEGKQQKEHSEKERMRTRVESSHHRQLVKATCGFVRSYATPKRQLVLCTPGREGQLWWKQRRSQGL